MIGEMLKLCLGDGVLGRKKLGLDCMKLKVVRVHPAAFAPCHTFSRLSTFQQGENQWVDC